MLGLPCFFFEVVSSPQRDENRLLRLLADLDMACVLLLTPDSPVRAATCKAFINESIKRNRLRTVTFLKQELYILRYSASKNSVLIILIHYTYS